MRRPNQRSVHRVRVILIRSRRHASVFAQASGAEALHSRPHEIAPILRLLSERTGNGIVSWPRHRRVRCLERFHFGLFHYWHTFGCPRHVHVVCAWWRRRRVLIWDEAPFCTGKVARERWAHGPALPATLSHITHIALTVHFTGEARLSRLHYAAGSSGGGRIMKSLMQKS